MGYATRPPTGGNFPPPRAPPHPPRVGAGGPAPPAPRGRPAAPPFLPVLRGAADRAAGRPVHEERKVVTVLFCDLVGFTAASEAADPEDVRARIRPYHARLRQEIERYGGTVEKFIGDAVMAVFGAPDGTRGRRRARRPGRPSHPGGDRGAERGRPGARAPGADRHQHRRGGRRARRPPRAGRGIVTGDVVNTASRLQGAAPVNGIAVSEQTYRQTERVFDYEELEPVAGEGQGGAARPLPPARRRAPASART